MFCWSTRYIKSLDVDSRLAFYQPSPRLLAAQLLNKYYFGQETNPLGLDNPSVTEGITKPRKGPRELRAVAFMPPETATASAWCFAVCCPMATLLRRTQQTNDCTPFETLFVAGKVQDTAVVAIMIKSWCCVETQHYGRSIDNSTGDKKNEYCHLLQQRKRSSCWSVLHYWESFRTKDILFHCIITYIITALFSHDYN